MPTIADKLNAIPPFVCRLLARKNHGRDGLSHAEIAKLSNLSKSTVAELSLKTEWDGVPVDVAVAFALACGVNHLACRAQRDYFKRRIKTYVYNGDANRRRFYDRLLELFKVKYGSRSG